MTLIDVCIRQSCPLFTMLANSYFATFFLPLGNFHLWNSTAQPLITRRPMAWWGSGPRVPPLCHLISFYSCNALSVGRSLIRHNGLSLNFELRSSNHVCSPGWKWITSGQISFSSCRELASILPVSLYSGRWFAVTDGAMPGRAERHKQLISAFLLECRLSAREEEWQLRFLNLTAKTKNRTSLSTKGFFKKCPTRFLSYQTRVLSDSD